MKRSWVRRAPAVAEGLLSVRLPATVREVSAALDLPDRVVRGALVTLKAHKIVTMAIRRPNSREPATWAITAINHAHLTAFVAAHVEPTSATEVTTTTGVPTIINPARIREAALGAYFKGCLSQLKVIAAAGGDAKTIARYCDETIACAPLED